jgi:hypothetical protein
MIAGAPQGAGVAADGLKRRMALPARSANQKLPWPAAAMPSSCTAPGTGQVVICPELVIRVRQMSLVNHTPSSRPGRDVVGSDPSTEPKARHLPAGGDAADREPSREPHGAVRSGSDPSGVSDVSRQRPIGIVAPRGHPSDPGLVVAAFGDPQRSVGRGSNAVEHEPGLWRSDEQFPPGAVGAEPLDPGPIALSAVARVRHPHRAARARDRVGGAMTARLPPRHAARRRDPHNLHVLGYPDRAVRTHGQIADEPIVRHEVVCAPIGTKPRHAAVLVGHPQRAGRRRRHVPRGRISRQWVHGLAQPVGPGLPPIRAGRRRADREEQRKRQEPTAGREEPNPERASHALTSSTNGQGWCVVQAWAAFALFADARLVPRFGLPTTQPAGWRAHPRA